MYLQLQLYLQCAQHDKHCDEQEYLTTDKQTNRDSDTYITILATHDILLTMNGVLNEEDDKSNCNNDAASVSINNGTIGTATNNYVNRSK